MSPTTRDVAVGRGASYWPLQPRNPFPPLNTLGATVKIVCLPDAWAQSGVCPSMGMAGLSPNTTCAHTKPRNTGQWLRPGSRTPRHASPPARPPASPPSRPTPTVPPSPKQDNEWHTLVLSILNWPRGATAKAPASKDSTTAHRILKLVGRVARGHSLLYHPPPKTYVCVQSNQTCTAHTDAEPISLHSEYENGAREGNSTSAPLVGPRCRRREHWAPVVHKLGRAHP